MRRRVSIFVGLAAGAAAIVGLAFFVQSQRSTPPASEPVQPPAAATHEGLSQSSQKSESDLGKAVAALKDATGGNVPAGATVFDAQDLGVRFAFVAHPAIGAPSNAPAKGAVVVEIALGSAARASGLRVNDVVMAIDGKPIASGDDLRQALRRIGARMTMFKINRGSDLRTIFIDCSKCSRER